MARPGTQRRTAAPRLSALCGALLALAVFPGAASALIPNPTSNFSEPIPSFCSTTTSAVRCTQAGIVALDDGRASEGEPPYQLPSDFLELSGAHQLVVLTNLDRAADGLRQAPGTTAALDRSARAGAESWTDPTVDNPDLSWAANWAGNFPAAVWAYFTWMYDDGYGGPNADCTAPRASGCWGHRNDILARFTTAGGRLEMGAADVDGDSYAMVIAQTLPDVPVHYTYRAPMAR